MSRDSIVETSLAGLRPVGIGSRRTLDAWDQLVAFIEADPQLGAAHAQLFAEPVVEQGDSVEWYRPSELEGDLVACSELPAEEQEALKAHARQLSGEIQARADELRRSDREELRRMGETLATALLLPSGREILYSVGGKPVLVNWGTVDDVADPPLAELEDFLRAAPKAPAPARPEAAGGTTLFSTLIIRRPWSWWDLLWLLVALLLLALFILLLLGCGLGMPVNRTFLTYCPAQASVPGTDELALERQRTAELESELDRLMDQLHGLPNCARPDPDEEIPSMRRDQDTAERDDQESSQSQETQGTEEQEDDFDDRREEAGGEVGEITVTLIWDGYPDLDLIVQCPDGSIISYERPSSCGGQLDVDANGADDRRERPVENVYWPEGSAGAGEYKVYVDNFDGREAGASPVPFSVRVQIGDKSEIYEGEVAPPGNGDFVTSFTIE